MIPQPFTADLCARAIVAAARIYCDDPLIALASKRGHRRRSLSAAAHAIAQVTAKPQTRVSMALGIGLNTVSHAKAVGGDVFLTAVTQALLAVGGAAAALAPSEPSPVQTAPIEGEFRVVESPRRVAAIARKPAPAPRASAKEDRAPEVFKRFKPEYQPPAPKRAQISTSDRAMIDAAIAAGIVKAMPPAVAEGATVQAVAIPDHPEPMVLGKSFRWGRPS
jgi:hypothetical protein